MAKRAPKGDIAVVASLPFDDDSSELNKTDEITVLGTDDSVDLPADGDAPPASAATEEVRERIKSLANTISSAYWELSELVQRVNNERLYRTWGFSTFEAWAKEECDLGRRKAFNLVKIQNYFQGQLKETLKDQPEVYAQAVETAKAIGWNKALKLATENVITAANAEEVLEVAQGSSLDDLETKCRTMFKELPEKDQEAAKESNDMKVLKKTFTLTTYQESQVVQGVEKALATMADKASDGSALALICGEYLATGPKDIVDVLSALERTYGCTLIAVNEKNEKILFGADALARLSSGDEDEDADLEDEDDE